MHQIKLSHYQFININKLSFQFIDEEFYDINSIIAIRGFKRNQYPFQHASGYGAKYTKLIDAMTVHTLELKEVVEYLVNDIVLCRTPRDADDIQLKYSCLEAVAYEGLSCSGNRLVTMGKCNAFTKIPDVIVAGSLNQPDFLDKVDIPCLADVDANIQVEVYNFPNV